MTERLSKSPEIQENKNNNSEIKPSSDLLNSVLKKETSSPEKNIDKSDNKDENKINFGEGMEEVDQKDLDEAAKIVKEAIQYIKENAKTEEEKKTAEALEKLYNEGKVIIEDTEASIGYPVYGYFNKKLNEKTRKDESYMVIDYNSLAYGKAETIDTIIHEAYHAAQYFTGHKNDSVEEETRAWNMGLDMSNKYREETGEAIVQTKPYTQSDIEDMGYLRTLGTGVFTELAKNNREELT